jgi:hypothetical protein
MKRKFSVVFLGAISMLLFLTGCSFFGGKTSNQSSDHNSNINYDKDCYIFVLNSDKSSYSVSMGLKAPKGEFHIPSSYQGLPVTEVRSNGFTGCEEITSLIFHGGVKKIGTSAFQSCGSLTSITFCESIERIEGFAFAFCYEVKEIKFNGDNYKEWASRVYVGENNDEVERILNRDKEPQKPDRPETVPTGDYVISFYLGANSVDINKPYLSPFLTGSFIYWAEDDINALEMVRDENNSTSGVIRYVTTLHIDSMEYQNNPTFCEYQLTLGYNHDSGHSNTGVNWGYKSVECAEASGSTGMENLSFEFTEGFEITLGFHHWDNIPEE